MANTLFIGKVYHRFAALSSTNDWAKAEAAKNKPPEGMVVRADSQSAGRGQFGSRWESEAGANLTFSVLLYPRWLAAGEQFWLSMAMALGVKDALAAALAQTAFHPDGLRLKWPNDLYLDQRKTGGILIENGLSGLAIQSSVVGIGLNVNQLHFPDDLPNATSLARAAQRRFALDELAEALFAALESRYLQLKSGRRDALKSDYLAALYRFGQPAEFQRTADGSRFTGTITGVTETGRIELDTAGGIETFDLKQLRFH